MNTKNILMGPKLGDFLHSLVVPAFYYHMFGFKTNLYINEVYDKFETSLEQTYEELMPILSQQDYINSFSLHNPNDNIFYDHDLNKFRQSPYMNCRSFWIIFLFTAFKNEPMMPKNFRALKLPKNQQFSDTLIISRKHERTVWNEFTYKQYDHVISQFDKKLFIAFDKKQYDDFPLKNKVDFLYVETLLDFMTIINSAKLTMCNISGPLCMASVLNSPRVGELGHYSTLHYALDHIFYDNVEFFGDGDVYTPETKYLLR